ncbi:hypothetical protein FDC58_17755 [Clostridium botulinum]|nr:hypothetical protein [Clostridium botulinum]NFP31036.1 hypothetical protein [Clostridium botulinum]
MYKLVTDNIDIMYNSNNIQWNTDTDTLGTQMSFDTIKDLYEGQVVSLFSDDRELVRGIIVEKTWNRWTFSYVVQDYSFYLKNKIPFKQFNRMKASDCIVSLLGEAYMTGSIVNIPTIITEMYRGKTRLDIIDDILEKAQNDQGIEYFKEIECTTVYIRQLQEMKITPAIEISKDVNVESSIENLKNRISVISNSTDDNSIYASAEDATYQYWYGVLEEVEEVDADNIANAQNIANNKLNELNKIERSTSIEIVCLDDGADIKANRLIYLNAGSRLCGFYKIKSASHTLNKEIHKVSLEIEWKVAA